jgi:hypothetical protein
VSAGSSAKFRGRLLGINPAVCSCMVTESVFMRCVRVLDRVCSSLCTVRGRTACMQMRASRAGQEGGRDVRVRARRARDSSSECVSASRFQQLVSEAVYAQDLALLP